MPHINPVDHATATGATKELLDGVKAGLGIVPNIFATFAHSPKVLEGYLALNGALGRGKLSLKLREQVALTVAGANGCNYCASAHTALAKAAGVAADELRPNLNAQSGNDATQAVLRFARKVVEQRGHVDSADIDAVRAAGFDEGDVVEIVTHIGINLFTNYFNHIVGTDIDFPLVEVDQAAQAA